MFCSDLPPRLYPTVGLQTPGEIIDANFGQEPFKFDIEGEMRELRRKTQGLVEELSWPRKQGEEQAVLHHMVLSYLVHHGYSQTAEGFARCVGQEISEELSSMRNRQHIQKLVLAGKIGEAISTVDQLYPSLLALNQDLHFRLKVRQFIEMVSGADSLDTDNDTSTSSANSSSIMDTEDTDNSPAAVNGSSSNNTSNGNIEADADNNTTDTMEVEAETVANRDNSIMLNPAKFECLIRLGRVILEMVFKSHCSRFGRRLHVFHEKLEQEKGRNTSNTQMLQVTISS